MHGTRITRVVLSLLGCCVALASSDRKPAVQGSLDPALYITKGEYLLAANLTESGADSEGSSTATDEMMEGTAEPSSTSTATPQSPRFRATPPPVDVANPEETSPAETIAPFDLPPRSSAPPSPEEPEKPVEPAEAQQEEKPEKTPPIALRGSWPNAAADSPLFGTESVAQFTDERRSRGKWSLRPHFNVGTVYDGNIFISNTGQQSGFIALISAGLLFQLGNGESPLSLIADYTATAELYLEDSSQDAINQRFSMDLRWTLKKLSLDFRAGVSTGNGTSIDIGNRVRRYAYSFGVGANYELSGKTSLTMNLTEDIADYGGYSGSSTTLLDAYVNYLFRPKLTLGVGGGVSFMSVQDDADQVSELLGVRAVYSPSQKLTFIGNFGGELREYSSGINSTFTPVFGITASWLPRQGTLLSLSASRRTYSSASLDGQNYIATGVALDARQRFTDRSNITLSVGYENLEYQAAQQNVSAGRVDNFLYIRPGFEVVMTSYCALGIYYEYSQDDSTDPAYGFTRDRLGLQLNLRY